MKKQLLMAAMAAMTLGASAQMTEVVRGADFSFLPKSLSATGEVIPYNVNNLDYYSDFLRATIYDQSFNEVKTINYTGKSFEYTETPMRATVDVSEKEREVVNDVTNGFAGETVDIESFDAFKEYVRSKYGNIPNVAFFITSEGYWAFSELQDRGGSFAYDEGGDYVTLSATIRYYNSDKKTIYSIYNDYNNVRIMINLDDVVWEIDTDKEPTVSELKERLYSARVANYDLDGISQNNFITQTLFNNDEKYEFIMRSYKETSAPTTIKDVTVGNYSNGKVTLCHDVRNKYFSDFVKVVNEDGDVLLSFDAYSNMITGSITFYQLNGKKYMQLPVSDDGSHYDYVLYLLGDSGTGVQEVARTKPVKVEKYYNAAGVQVDKDAKGIVITDGGKKYINQ